MSIDLLHLGLGAASGSLVGLSLGLFGGGLPLVFLPGEIFSTTALEIRAALADGPVPFVVSLSDGVPGYIPPREAYAEGGYEVLEAHRYYGLPAGFAPGSAEGLAEAAIGIASVLVR